MARQQHQRMRATWRAVVYAALTTLGGEASLNRLYATIEREAPEHVRRNRSWREKVRQTLQLDSRVESEQRGVWRFAA